jgi:hypothetical protein
VCKVIGFVILGHEVTGVDRNASELGKQQRKGKDVTQDTASGVGVEEAEQSLFLDDHLCFTLYAASRAVTGVYRPLLNAYDLTYPQYLVLLVLWEHGTVPVKDIVSRLHLDHGTLTPLLKRLEGR